MRTEPHIGLCLPQPGPGRVPTRCPRKPREEVGNGVATFIELLLHAKPFTCTRALPRGPGGPSLSDTELGHHLAMLSSSRLFSFNLYNGHNCASHLTVVRIKEIVHVKCSSQGFSTHLIFHLLVVIGALEPASVTSHLGSPTY